MTLQYADLHMHTTYSDALDDPAGVVRNAAIRGAQVIAITDHDHMGGYAEASQEAIKWGVTLVPGVEVTTRDYHILGLGVEPGNREFERFLQGSREIQKKVVGQRVEILQGEGMPITLEKVVKHFPKSRVGKYNLLITMMQDYDCRRYFERNGIEISEQELFQRYLGKQGVAGNVEKKYFLTSKEAIDAIHAANGIAVIAHPFKDIEDMSEMDVLRAEGIDGIEVQPQFNGKNEPFKEYAQKHGMKIIYGSDFHGAGFWRQLLGNRFDNKLDIWEVLNLKDPNVHSDEHGLGMF